MKNFRGFALGLTLGLVAAVSTMSFAQNPAPADQKAKTESCCAMESCCCKGDSCSMKNHAKEHSSKDGCCCCSGESCDMKMKAKENKVN